MVKLVNYAEASSGIKEYVADTEEELNTITACEMGSTVLVISSGKIFIKDGKENWVELGG
jgi:hypothetical protein